MKNNIFCNNCGKQGHVFHSCKLPIISNGIIVYRENRNVTSDKISIENKYEYLMIQRKDTLGYVDFLRGRYNLYNKLYLMNIINEMTIQEKIKIRSMTFDQLWSDLWCGLSSSQYKNEGRISKEKFDKLKTGIIINNNNVTLESLIKESKTRWIETEWGFPKGRRNYNEKDLTCAIREFEEETGYKKDDINIIYNILPYEEIFTGSNFKSYKHKYFVAILIYAFFTISISINAHEDDEILGYWLTSQSIVLIENCEGNLCATIEHIFVEEGTDPKSILDSKNKD